MGALHVRDAAEEEADDHDAVDLPNGSKLKANTRPRTSLVEAQVKDLSGKALPTGRWRCVIRAGGVVVATLNVRLT